MADIMQKNCQLRRFIFMIRNIDSLKAQTVQRLTHEMHGAQGVLKTCMQRPGIDQIGQSELLDIAETLKKRVRDYFKDEFAVDMDKSIQRVINDRLFKQGLNFQ